MPSEIDIFTEALTIAEADARAAYLDRVCAGDAAQRQRLNDLLNHHQCVNSVLDRSPRQIIESLEQKPVEPQGPDETDEYGTTLAALQPFLAAPTHADSKGRLGHYELLAVLGQGGYGIVWKALDTKLHRLVAVKILAPHLATTSPPRRRFLREARAAAAIRHRNVVQIYAVEEAPIPYLVMEFVAGETLQQRSDRVGPFPADEVVRIGVQIVAGLAAAHAQGLIHRDIKPSNILVEDGLEPVAKLTDFGLARTADDASRSQSGIVIGTPMYMSPEQVAGVELDQRADLFSLGSVLYLMTSGRPPFRAPSTLAVLKRVAEDHPRALRDIITETPRGLSHVIGRLHAKRREERFQTAQEVVAALANCLTRHWWTWSGWRHASWRAVTSRRAALGATVLVVGLTGLGFAEWTGQTHFLSSQASPQVESQVVSAQLSESGLKVLSRLPDSEWEREVVAMTAEQQVDAVTARLTQLNPRLASSSILCTIENDAVERILVQPADFLANIAPLHALRKLKWLQLFAEQGQLSDIGALQGLQLVHLDITGSVVTDLSPLRGMPLKDVGFWPFRGNDLTPLRGMRLKSCNFGGGNQLQDLEPLRGMPLELACFNYSEVADLSPLQGMPLRKLEIEHTRVEDITPLSGSVLEYLGMSGTPVQDLTPLRTMTELIQIQFDYSPARDRPLISSLPKLRLVNNTPLRDLLPATDTPAPSAPQ